MELTDKFRAASVTDVDEAGITLVVLPTASDLLYYYKEALVRMKKVSTRKAFVDLSRVFAKYLRVYCEVLQSKLPRYDAALTLVRQRRLFVLQVQHSVEPGEQDTAKRTGPSARPKSRPRALCSTRPISRTARSSRYAAHRRRFDRHSRTRTNQLWELVIGKHVGVQLEEKLKENVDANLADQIDLAQEADNFAKCASRRHMPAM